MVEPDSPDPQLEPARAALQALDEGDLSLEERAERLTAAQAALAALLDGRRD